MREYYKEKLANLSEIFRAIVLLALALISGIGAMIFSLVMDFNSKIFILIFFSLIFFVIIMSILIKLYLYISNMTKKLKE